MRAESDPLFDRIAELYERYAEINDGVYRPFLERWLPEHAASGIDLGCGSGRFSELLAARCDRVLAVDIAAREVEIARTRRNHPNLEYRVGSLLEVSPERDGQFDVVMSVNTLFHLYAEHERADVLRHVRSLVAPGGHAVVIDVVSPGAVSRLRHRWWGVGEAARTVRRRRSLADAWTVLRVRQHPVWMEHTGTNLPLTRTQFHTSYAECFPGAEFDDTLDPFICAMYWRNQ